MSRSYYDDTIKSDGIPPYPRADISWDPVENLDELNRSSYNNSQSGTAAHPYKNLAQYPGPPLPSRPPQHIINQHIQFTGNHQQPNYATPERVGSNKQTSTSGRLRGPRDLPSKFSNPSLNSPLQTHPQHYNQSFGTPSTPDLIDGRFDHTQHLNSSPIVTDFTQSFRASPFTTPTTPAALSGPRPIPQSSPIQQPSYSSPSYLRRSPEKHQLSLNTSPFINENTYHDQNQQLDFLDSPSISVLPDVPPLTPSSIIHTPNFYDRRQQQHSSAIRTSPSPTRAGLFGPRARPSNSSIRQVSPSPSTSPNKNYYEYRNSWRSEYSVNIIDLEDEENTDIHNHNEHAEHLYQFHDGGEEIDLFRDDIVPVTPIFESPTKLNNNHTSENLFEAIDLSESQPIGSKRNSKIIEKDLPSLPTSLELPSLPFSSHSLSESQFEECSKIYLLSDVFQWSIKLSTDWSDGLLITKLEYIKILKQLFKRKASKLKPFTLNKNIESILKSFEKQNAIYVDENEHIFFLDNVRVNGVFPQLMNCYSKSHDTKYQCYSSRCSLTIHQPPIPTIPAKETISGKLGEWTTYWGLTALDLKELDQNEVKKQSHIFELIRQQQNIIKLGELQVKIYGQSFKKTKPQLLPDVSKFYNDAFNSVKPLIELHKKHLLEPLISKLNTQGKFISGIGQIFIDWANLANVPYLRYTEKMASVRELIKYEKSNKSRFANWLLEIDGDPRIVEASLDHNRIFFSGFVGHTQLLSLALQSVHKKTKDIDEDYNLLADAIKILDKLNRKIDETQESALQRRQLSILSKQLSWRSNVIETDLRLDEPIRRTIKIGKVTRKDKYWTNSRNVLILLDNYLIITEPQKENHLKITEKPIPIEFLQLETKEFINDLSEVPTPSKSEAEGEAFPFKLRYTGQNISFTFFTDTLSERESWFKKFNEVKFTKDSNSQNEAFEISILSDQFAYEEGQQPQKLPILIPNSNIDKVLKSFNKTLAQEFQGLSITSRPIMLSEILSGTTITFQERQYHLLGLNFGLFITEVDNPRGWKRVLDLNKITQVEQLESLIVLISDKGLYYFNIISLLLNYYDINEEGSIVGARLSRRDVNFFQIGNYYNTKLLFMLKSPLQTMGASRFKVFTPIFDSFGIFQYFQLYKKFQFGLECFGISIFNSMFVLHTSKGFEIMSFQASYESQPIPKFIEITKKPKTELDLIKKRLKSSNCKPLLMSKVLNKPQFYLIYDTFTIVIDTIGQLISDKFIFPFKFKCSKVTIHENYLICIGDDIVEIFDLNYDDLNGFVKNEPIQIINGKDVKLVDAQNCKISMAHPKILGRQLIIELKEILT